MLKITAEEMKKISDSTYTYTEEEIEKEIRSRAERGFDFTRFDLVKYIEKDGNKISVRCKIPENIISNLRENGFYVDISMSYNPPKEYYYISWNGEKYD